MEEISFEQPKSDPKKLILGVPFYGHKFTVSTFGIKAPKVAGTSVPSVSLPNTTGYGTKWDPASKTPYWEWMAGGVKYQAWYENGESMRIKLAGVKAAGFGGMGMWKLPWGTEPIWTEIDRYVNGP